MNLVEVKVPDIGDFSDVPVIDLFVKVGDSSKVDDAIATLESDKATMDVPSTVAGTVTEVLIQLGSRVSEGAVLIKVEAGANATVSPEKAPKSETPAAAPAAPAPVAASHGGGADIECDMLVLGAGPGGYSAAFRSADLGLKTVIVERYATLGGVCLNVGCIPSKALLHVAEIIEEAQHANDLGVTFAAPQVDIDKLRAHKEKVVGKLTDSLAGMAKGRKVDIERRDLTGDHRTGNIELLRGSGKAAEFGDANKQLHGGEAIHCCLPGNNHLQIVGYFARRCTPKVRPSPHTTA